MVTIHERHIAYRNKRTEIQPLKGATVIERDVSDARYNWKRLTRQYPTIVERSVCNRCDTIREIDVNQCVTSVKSVLSDDSCVLCANDFKY